MSSFALAVPTTDTQQHPPNLLQIARAASAGASGRDRRRDAANGVYTGDPRAGSAYAANGGYDRRTICCVLVGHREIPKETGAG